MKCPIQYFIRHALYVEIQKEIHHTMEFLTDTPFKYIMANSVLCVSVCMGEIWWIEWIMYLSNKLSSIKLKTVSYIMIPLSPH